MREKIRSEPISRRTMLSLLAAAVGLTVPATVLTASEAEAQTIGMERRQDRRQDRRALRYERRAVRRTARTVRRIDRRTGVAPY